MLTGIEYQQLKVAISHMYSPYTINGNDACLKKHIMELLDQYTESEKNETK